MPKKNTGSLELRDGVYFTRISRQVNGKRERDWYCLETGDRDLALKKRKALKAALDAGRLIGLPGAVGAGSASASPNSTPSMPRFEDYARSWHAKRVRDEVAMAKSELGYLELHVFDVNIGQEEARFGLAPSFSV